MRVLDAVIHFAEQLLAGDQIFVSQEERARALDELGSVEEAYIAHWLGAARPSFYKEQSTLFLKTIHDIFEACRQVQIADDVLFFCLDGWVVDGHKYPKRPWAIFYVASPLFFGFHIRFQEIARGGLRTVVPRSLNVESQDRSQIFCECYDLAFTQELKNKDLPEGGSKGVIFVSYAHAAEMEKCQKLYIDALLRYLVTTNEWIFLGPDERMSNEMLEWIGCASKKSGYSLGSAFISSRVECGINHKQYAVTSEGLMVYIEESLIYRGFKPDAQPFKVKISGGPDGDVAGNTIKLLAKRFPKTAQIVAIKDVSGILYDPMGIPFDALLPLVEKELPCACVDLLKLSSGSFVLDMRQEVSLVRKNGNAVEREKFDPTAAATLFDGFLHRLHADLFVPAGGRRFSLRRENIADFMPDGIPSCPIIIEGANVYLTQDARDILEASGVLIIRDSSANKGGVICSSYEIETLLTLGESGLIAHRDSIVAEILSKITHLCRYEAQILFEEREIQKKHCTILSNELSVAMRSLSTQLLVWIQNWKDSLYWACVERHFLPTIWRLGSDVTHKLPTAYLDAVVASFISSRLVYRYGAHFPYEPHHSILEKMAIDALDFENQHSS